LDFGDIHGNVFSLFDVSYRDMGLDQSLLKGKATTKKEGDKIILPELLYVLSCIF